MTGQRLLPVSTHLEIAGSAAVNASAVRENSDSGRFTGSATSPALNRDLSRRASRRVAPGKRSTNSASLSTVNVLFNAEGTLARILSRCNASMQRISSARPTIAGVRARERKAETAAVSTPRLFSSAAASGCIAVPGRAHKPALVAEGTSSIPFHRNSAIGERQRFAVQTKSISDTFTAYPRRIS